jgi:hypothetical protein
MGHQPRIVLSSFMAFSLSDQALDANFVPTGIDRVLFSFSTSRCSKSAESPRYTVTGEALLQQKHTEVVRNGEEFDLARRVL